MCWLYSRNGHVVDMFIIITVQHISSPSLLVYILNAISIFSVISLWTDFRILAELRGNWNSKPHLSSCFVCCIWSFSPRGMQTLLLPQRKYFWFCLKPQWGHAPKLWTNLLCGMKGHILVPHWVAQQHSDSQHRGCEDHVRTKFCHVKLIFHYVVDRRTAILYTFST